jgi:hypothetical protein
MTNLRNSRNARRPSGNGANHAPEGTTPQRRGGRSIDEDVPDAPPEFTYKKVRQMHEDDASNPPMSLVNDNADVGGRCIDNKNEWHAALLQTFPVGEKGKEETGMKITTRGATEDPEKIEYWAKRIAKPNEETKEKLTLLRDAAIENKTYAVRGPGDNISAESGLIFHKNNSDGKAVGTDFMKVWKNPYRNITQLFVHQPGKSEKEPGYVCTFDLPNVVKTKSGRFITKLRPAAGEEELAHTKSKAPDDEDRDEDRPMRRRPADDERRTEAQPEKKSETVARREPEIRFEIYGNKKECKYCIDLDDQIAQLTPDQRRNVIFDHVNVTEENIESFSDATVAKINKIGFPLVFAYADGKLVEEFGGGLTKASELVAKIAFYRDRS